MEKKEYIENEEIVEPKEETAIEKTEDGKKIGAVGIAAIVGAGYLIYKKVVKPTITKIKTKHKSKVETSETSDAIVVENDEEFDANE